MIAAGADGLEFEASADQKKMVIAQDCLAVYGSRVLALLFSSPTVTLSVKLLCDMVCVLIDSFYMHIYRIYRICPMQHFI